MHPRIVQLGDQRLFTKSLHIAIHDPRPIELLWGELRSVLDDVMKQHEFRNCAGISAVQIGIPQRACLIWLPQIGYKYVANPRIVDQSMNTYVEYEGCLSFFDKRGLAARPSWSVVAYTNASMVEVTERLDGWPARIMLHEIDHMDGILYTSHLSDGEHLIPYREYKQRIHRMA